MQIPEHTWGLDVKTFLADYSNWSNKEFQEQLESGAWNYRCWQDHPSQSKQRLISKLINAALL